MNFGKIGHYFNLGVHVARAIGFRNIAFFGLLGTSIAAKYIFSNLANGFRIRTNLTIAFNCSKE